MPATAPRLACLALFLSSCAFTSPAVPHQVPFNGADFARYRGAGSSTVLGHLEVELPVYGRQVGTGDMVSLLPANRYTWEVVDSVLGNGQRIVSDERLHQYIRVTKTDGQGNFRFSPVPSGEYYATALVSFWDGSDYQYQWAFERVTVGKGQTAKIQLSKNINRPDRGILVDGPGLQ